MIRLFALVMIFMPYTFCGQGTDVESGTGVVLQLWDLLELPGDLRAQIEENWFSRGSAFWGYGLWLFNIIAHFFTLVVLNMMLGKFLAQGTGKYDGNRLITFGRGLIYLTLTPVLIVFCLASILSIPFGLLLLATYLISIWLGDCLAALLLCYFLNSRNERSWNFWTIVLLSLGIVVTIDLLIFLPLLGILIYIVILAFAYGVFISLLKQTYPNLNILNEQL